MYADESDSCCISLTSDGGWICIKKDDEVLFEGTERDTKIVFWIISKMFGKRKSIKLIKKDREQI